jgi:hypothetical protein
MLRPSNRGDAGENRHNLIKNPPALENQKPRGLLKLSKSKTFSASSLVAHLGLIATQLKSAFSVSKLGPLPKIPAQKTQAKVGPKLLKRSYPSSIQSLFPFFTSKLELHSTTNPSKKQIRINHVNYI